MPESGAQGLLVDLRQPGHGTRTLTSAVYNELRQLAHHYLREEPSGHSLQATALVHEVYQRQDRDPDRLLQLSLRRVFK